MRDTDSLILENLYQGMYLFEGVEDQQKQAENLLVAQKVGRDVWKNKNKPENQEVVQKAKEEIQPIYQKLLKIVEPYQQDQFGRNMAHLPELTKFYLQKPDLDLIEKEYKTYMSLGSVKQKNLIKKEPDFIKWAEGVHSAEALEKYKKEGEVSKKDEDKVVSGDENKKYEDENIIVFLANNINDPKESVKNCIKYGKGSSLCISGSSARSYYHNYRWEDKLTTYFVWLKKDNKYMLVDAAEDGHYQYNNIYDNEDRRATPQQIIQKYPVLEKPFKERIFVSVPIEGKELDFYEKFYEKDNIFDFESLEDRVNYASFNDIKDSDWSKIPELQLKPILQTYIESTENDIPEEVLKQYPPLEKRYWQKVENNLSREIEDWNDREDKLNFSPHEIKILFNNKKLYDRAIEKITAFRDDIQRGENVIKYALLDKMVDGSLYGDIQYESKYKNLNFPELKKIHGYIDANKTLEINLPNLELSRNIDAGSALIVNLPRLQKSRDLYFSSVDDLNLPNLIEAEYISAARAKKINIPKLQKCNQINARSAVELYLQELREVDYIASNKSIILNLQNLEKITSIININSVKKINIPNLRESGSISAQSANEVFLPKLQKTKIIDAINASEIYLPELKECEKIQAYNAKKIVILKHLKNKLEGVPQNCEIIHPEEQEVKLESFKRFFSRKHGLII